jgi:hypothetical protein
MRHITVTSIIVSNGKLFSEGAGIDDDGDFVKFIGHTYTMGNIKKDLDAALDDFGEGEKPERPSIYLEAWQVI